MARAVFGLRAKHAVFHKKEYAAALAATHSPAIDIPVMT